MSIEALIEQLKSSNPGTQVEAARTLGKLQSSDAFAPLLEAIRDPNREVRKAVVQALGDVGDLRAVEPLLNLAADAELGNVEEDWQGPNPYEHVLAKFGPEAVDILLKYLDDDKFSWLVIPVLGLIGDHRAVVPLMRIVDAIPLDAYDDRRAAAISALGSLKDPRAFDIIATYVRHLSSGSAATYALGHIGDPRAVPILEDLLYHPVANGLHSAVGALRDMGSDQALETLTKFALQEKSRNRIAAISALSHSKDPRLEPFFREIVEAAADEEGCGYAADYFLRLGKRQMLETMATRAPEAISTVIRWRIERFR
jgi:HEAT repeat protein